MRPAASTRPSRTWSTQGVYARIKLLDHLPRTYTCILFDRRECGQSGGRVERVTWTHYVAQGKGLLDHLDIKRAHIMGGCMGCARWLAFGVAYPETTLSMMLFWPVGGAKYRMRSHQRFAEHLAFVQQHGLEAVVELVAQGRQAVWRRPARRALGLGHQARPGLRRSLREQNVDAYKLIVAGMASSLFDRDTAPGAEPEDLMRLDIPALVIPGHDASHTPRRRRATWRNACRGRSIGTYRLRSRQRRRCRRECWNFLRGAKLAVVMPASEARAGTHDSRCLRPTTGAGILGSPDRLASLAVRDDKSLSKAPLGRCHATRHRGRA